MLLEGKITTHHITAELMNPLEAVLYVELLGIVWTLSLNLCVVHIKFQSLCSEQCRIVSTGLIRTTDIKIVNHSNLEVL